MDRYRLEIDVGSTFIGAVLMAGSSGKFPLANLPPFRAMPGFSDEILHQTIEIIQNLDVH